MLNFSEVEFDRLLGRRLKFYRNALSLSQKDMASKLNISYQQYQKYETGRNKVSISRLVEICDIYRIFPDKFLSSVLGSFLGDSSSKDLFYDAESLRVLSMFYKYSPPVRKKIVDLLEVVEG